MRRLIGSRSFYRTTLALLIPVIIQNGLTNFVNLLDNVMIGRVGTEEMSGVAISNQLIFIFTLFIFGAVSGAGIFTAQFHGFGDVKGVRATFRFKLISCTLIALLCMGIFALWGEPLIALYLREGDSTGDATATLAFGRQYMLLMLIGMIPQAIAQVYASTLRETGETKLPMISVAAAIVTNCALNYILIFGKFGAPELGVRGAAIATVISRFVELAVIAIATHCCAGRYTFIRGAYRSMYIPWNIVRDIIRKGLPLTVNEVLWAVSIAMINQCYSMRGIAAVAGINICTTVSNLFNSIFFSMGAVIAIMVGRELGANKIEEARSTAAKLIAFSVMLSTGVGIVIAVTAPYISLIYNTSDEVRAIATGLMRMVAILTPFMGLTHSCYFAIRSGGKTVITFLFDSVFMLAVYVPLAYALSRWTSLPIVPLYLLCQAPELIKSALGIIIVRGGSWAKNIVKDKASGDAETAAQTA
ncbi:MAG: MATE family efflux transporter [Clostridia bacterium]|nr:MATE family efflux transporter [Clostridia bacterium]